MENKQSNLFELRSELPELKEEGFTLVEMLIVITLIGVIMTFVGGNIIGKFNKSRVDTTKIQMKQLGNVLDDFNRVCGFFPTSDQGLDALVKAPGGRECKNYDPDGFIKKIPQDAWNHDFGYESDGSKYVLKSLGSDGKEGGTGLDKDISSDEL